MSANPKSCLLDADLQAIEERHTQVWLHGDSYGASLECAIPAGGSFGDLAVYPHGRVGLLQRPALHEVPVVHLPVAWAIAALLTAFELNPITYYVHHLPLDLRKVPQHVLACTALLTADELYPINYSIGYVRHIPLY